MLNRLAWSGLVGFLGIFCFTLTGSEPEQLKTLEPLNVHSRVSMTIVDQIRAHHIRTREIKVDDSTSSKIFDQYLESLDPARQFLLQADVQRFEVFRDKIDDALRLGALSIGFEIYNTSRTRRYERFQWILDRLEEGIDTFDLDSDGTIEYRDDESVWFVDSDAADRWWESYLIDRIIIAKLSGDDLDEIHEALTARFTRTLRRESQMNSEDAFTSYMNAFAMLFDPHTQYLNPRVMENFKINMDLSLKGIGAILREADDYIVVEKLIKGGPAMKHGGIEEGDRISGVRQRLDGPVVNVVGWRVDDVVDMIRGPKGSTVYLELLQPEEKGNLKREVAIVRDEVVLEESSAQQQMVTLELEDQGDGVVQRKVGVIDLPSMYINFDARKEGSEDYRSASRDVLRLIEELKEDGMEALIIDLRGNGGGSLEEAQKLTGLFIDVGPTVQVRNSRRGTQVLLDRDRGVAWAGPLAVIVDRRSASASEIFAGAIQDYGRGIIVGNRTFGKGTVQQLLPLNHGQLKITLSKFYRVSGESTQHRGVVPDIRYPSYYDADTIGESSLDGALIYSIIDGVEFEPVGDISPYLTRLQEMHERRVSENPDFLRRVALEERRKEDRERSQDSINFDVRQAKRDSDQSKFLAEVGNPWLVAKGLEPVETISEFNDRSEDYYDDLPEDQPDFILLETSHIVTDLADLISGKGRDETTSLGETTAPVAN